MAPVHACAEVVLLCDGAEIASWPLPYGHPVDIGVVDELARIQLEARRQGCALLLRRACPRLVELLELVGLSEVIAVGADDHRPGA